MEDKMDKIIQYAAGATFCACLLSIGHMSASFRERTDADYTRPDGKPLSTLQCLQLVVKDTVNFFALLVKP